MKITYDEKEMEIEKGTLVKEVFSKEIEESENIIIAAKCNYVIVSLNHELEEDERVELIDITTKEGMSIYTKGLLYILGKAFKELYPDIKITVDYQLSNSLLCEVIYAEITSEMIENVENKMREIVTKDIPFRKIRMSKEEAEKFYAENGSKRGRLQLEAKEKEYVSLYYCEEYFNYFFGAMPISSGYMKNFKLEKYHDGFLVRYPNASDPTKLQPFVENKKLLQALDDYEDLHKELKIDTIEELNQITREGKIRETILIDEALHEKKIVEIANEIVKRNGIRMVLIAGPSSSGKTTFAKRLGLQLKANGRKPVTISVDNYFVEREQTPKDEHGNYDFESIEAIDLELFNDHLVRLLNGEAVELPSFDFATGTKLYKGDIIQVGKDEILVIEGIHCLNDRLTSQIVKEQKYKIYISALAVLNMDYFNRISTTDSRIIRRMVRDNQFRGYPALQTLKMWYSVNRGEQKNIFPFQEEADIMFNTSLIYELRRTERLCNSTFKGN